MNGTLQKEQLIYDHLNKAVEQINAIENTADKAVLLGRLWSQIHGLADNIARNNNFVSQSVVENFFAHHNKYNDYLHINMNGPFSKAYAIGVPVFSISSKRGVVKFLSMDSISEGVDKMLTEIQQAADSHRETIKTLDNILTKSDWELFVRELKLKSFATPSAIRKARKVLTDKRQGVQKSLDQCNERYNLIYDNKKPFMAFINEITRYVYQAFEQEGYTCELEDMDFENFLYLRTAVSAFLEREKDKGCGLSVHKDEGYWIEESVPFIKADSEEE